MINKSKGNLKLSWEWAQKAKDDELSIQAILKVSFYKKNLELAKPPQSVITI